MRYLTWQVLMEGRPSPPLHPAGPQEGERPSARLRGHARSHTYVYWPLRAVSLSVPLSPLMTLRASTNMSPWIQPRAVLSRVWGCRTPSPGSEPRSTRCVLGAPSSQWLWRWGPQGLQRSSVGEQAQNLQVLERGLDGLLGQRGRGLLGQGVPRQLLRGPSLPPLEEPQPPQALAAVQEAVGARSAGQRRLPAGTQAQVVLLGLVMITLVLGNCGGDLALLPGAAQGNTCFFPPHVGDLFQTPALFLICCAP